MKHLFTCLLAISLQTPLLAQQPTLGLPLGHDNPVGNLQFSADGKYIVSSSADGAILWEAATGRMVRRFDEKGYISDSFIQNQENRTLIITVDSRADKILITDARTEKLIKEIEGRKAAFSPDGSLFATYSYMQARTRLWDARSFEFVSEFSGYFVGFADSELVIVENERFTAFRATDGEVVYRIGSEDDDTIDRLLVSADRKLLVALSADGLLRVYEASTGLRQGDVEIEGEVKDVQFSKDQQYLAVNLFSKRSYLIKLNSRRNKVQEFIDTEILAIAETSSGSPSMIYQQEDEIIGYDLEKEEELYRISNLVDGQCGFKKSPDNRFFLAVVCGDTNPYTANSYAGASFSMHDSETGRFIHSFSSSVNRLRYVTVSPDRRYISTIAHTAKSQIFDFCKGNLQHVLSTDYAISAMYSDDSEYLATTSDMRLVDTGSDLGKEVMRTPSRWIWSVATGELVEPIIEQNYASAYPGMSKSRKFDITTSWDDPKVALIMKYESGLGDPVQTLRGHQDEITQAKMLDDSLTALTVSKDRTVKIWDIPTGTVKLNLTEFDDEIASTVYQPEGKLLLTRTITNQYKIWDISTGQTIHSFHLADENKERPVSNNRYTVNYDKDIENLEIFDVGTNEKLFTLSDHLDLITSFQFVSGTNYLLTSSYDGSIIIWDISKGEKVLQQFIFEDKEPIWLLPNGYYFASREAASKLYYVQGLQTIGFEQLDVKYNRPDKVLEVLSKVTGCDNTVLRKAYRKAWEKRIQKLKIDTTSFQQGFSVPNAELLNRTTITYQQKDDRLSLLVTGMDSMYLLDRFNVWINEVPLFGQNGISLVDRQTHKLDTTLEVQLSTGQNKIETSILNVNGIESYRRPLYVNYVPKKAEQEKLYFVGIGIDEYREAGHDLNYSVKDIRDLSLELKKKYGALIEIDTLFNKSVTARNIEKLKQSLLKTNVNDKVILSFSGHGLLSQDLDYYLATYTVDFEAPEKGGLPYDRLEQLLDGIPARQKLMLIDACHSGEVDKQEVESIEQVGKLAAGVKGTGVVVSKKPALGMQNSFELMKQLFINIDRSTGATIISAAAGTQFALERGDLENGVFTYCILDELRNSSSISVNQLREVIFERVPKLTGGLQQPTSRTETIENDWIVWK